MALPDASVGATYTATYVEAVAISAARAAALLQHHGEASRDVEGTLRFEALQRIERPAHFMILAAWRDRDALDAYQRRTEDFSQMLGPLLVSPPDVRLHHGLSLGPGSEQRDRGSVYAVTHVDVVPPQKESGAALLERLADESRSHVGNLRFDVWRQTSRPNHFTVVEIWTDLAALETHAMTDAARRFREALAPMSGALYDERLYIALPAVATPPARRADSTSTRLEAS